MFKEDKMKKILSFLLVLVMLCMAFTGCAEKTDEETLDKINTEASEATVTLALHLVSEEEVSPEVEAEIEAAVNTITESKFKTRIDLHYHLIDNYHETIDEYLLKCHEDSLEGGFWDDFEDDEDEESQTEEETIINELGIPELKYPEITDYQVDIFYIGGYDNFVYFDENGFLEDLTDLAKDLSDDVFPNFFTGIKRVSNGTFAVPTNRAIGEYTFMLLNKEALKDANYSASDFTTIYDANCQDFLEIIAENYREEYVPFYSKGDLFNSIPYVKYWGAADGQFNTDFSVLGAAYVDAAKFGEASSITFGRNTLSIPAFKSHVTAVRGYDFKGYYATEEETAAKKDFAVGYVVGGAEVIEDYSDKYEIVTLAKPFLTTELLYSDLFAVSTYTSNASRSMDILEYLNSNKDFKNLILYGVEGVHYEMVEDDNYLDDEGNPYMVVRRLTDDNGKTLYMMDNAKTGNMLNALPLEGEDPRWTEFAKVTNRDASLSLSLGFVFGWDGYPMDPAVFEDIARLSKETYEGIMACESEEELDAYLKKQETRINNNKSFKNAITDNDPTGELALECETFTEIYRQWLTNMGLFKVERG